MSHLLFATKDGQDLTDNLWAIHEPETHFQQWLENVPHTLSTQLALKGVARSLALGVPRLLPGPSWLILLGIPESGGGTAG